MINDQGKEVGKMTASDTLFDRDFNEALVHQLVTAYRSNARSGNRQQKSRSEVRHTTSKPWRQKGTGRARSGMTSSPIWRGGGRAFPNTPQENFSHKVNRKMYRVGMAAIFSELNRQGRLLVVEDLKIEAPKTKLFNQKLKDMGLDASILVITDELDENLYLSSRNLPNTLVLEVRETDPFSLVRFPKVLTTRNAIAKLEELWA